MTDRRMPGQNRRWRLIASFGFALRGVAVLVRTQANARIHLAAAIAVAVAGIAFQISRMEWCAVVAAIGLVWMAEGLNTAIENIVDLVSPEHHPLAGRAKDTAAGAVLLASLAAVIVGALVFAPRLAALWNR